MILKVGHMVFCPHATSSLQVIPFTCGFIYTAETFLPAFLTLLLF